MLASSTHDTKRSEDVRARLSLLSEIPAKWEAALKEWSALNKNFKTATCPDANTEYLIYQTMIGAWPLGKDRLLPYMEKATREAKRKTSWLAPNEDFEKATARFIESLYSNEPFLKSLEAFVEELIIPGRINSLAALLLKLTSPGVPDIYQGTEIWNLSLVDPDNRRPVNYAERRRLLREVKRLSVAEIMNRMDDGLPKLWTIYQTLCTRHQRTASFGKLGAYSPIYAEGQLRDCVVAYQRASDVVAIVPRLVMKTLATGWGDTSLSVPAGDWLNVLSGEQLTGGKVELVKLLDAFPIALLIKRVDV
jgi:(1->4)-alpha-D-glucan 1-alpha-D-glucosylmutase